MSDFDRPLNKRGLSIAPMMGEYLAGAEMLPQLIVTSTAKRASETAMLVKRHGDMQAKLRYDENIYEASVNTLANLLRAIDDSVNSVMLVGHNPGMESLIYYLSGEMQPMPTAAVAWLEYGGDDWRSLDNASCRLLKVLRPKEIFT